MPDQYKDEIRELIYQLSDTIFDLYNSLGIEYDDVCELVDMLSDEMEETA